MKNSEYAKMLTEENTKLKAKLRDEKTRASNLELGNAILHSRLNAIVDCYETLAKLSERRVLELRGAHKGMQRMQRKLRAAQSDVMALNGALKNVREMRAQSEDALRARVSMDAVNAQNYVKPDLRHGRESGYWGTG